MSPEKDDNLESSQSSSSFNDVDSKGDLSQEVIEQEAGETLHSDASKLSDVKGESMEDNTNPGMPKSVNNDR